MSLWIMTCCMFRESCLEPKHKIFLNHNRAQKDFTKQLCKDLGRIHHFPFFDKHLDSLCKGENFPLVIKKAPRQCLVVVLVILEEFFIHSKWPMIEFIEFVYAQESTHTCLKILLLFVGITMEEFKDKKRRHQWLEKWQVMALEDCELTLRSRRMLCQRS